jgi:hypothetical protein
MRRILGIKVREEFPAETPTLAARMRSRPRAAHQLLEIVSGEEKLPIERDERRTLTG